MRRGLRLLVAIVAVLAASGFDYARYVPSNLADAEAPSCIVEQAPATSVDFSLAPVRFEGIATPRSRPLAEDAVHVIAMFNRMNELALPDIGEEVLVRIDGQERWVLIQSQLMTAWHDELDISPDGRPGDLYVMRLGCHVPPPPAQPRVLFVINSFRVDPPAPPEI